MSFKKSSISFSNVIIFFKKWQESKKSDKSHMSEHLSFYKLYAFFCIFCNIQIKYKIETIWVNTLAMEISYVF